MAAINEVIQWLALLGLTLLVLAAYRQLGAMAIGSRRLFTESFGPAVGERPRAALAAIFGHDLGPNPARRHLALFVQQNCSLCSELLAQLERRRGGPAGDGIVAIVADGDVDYLDALRIRFDGYVVETRARVLPRQEPGGYPFTFLLDDDLLVLAKELGDSGSSLLEDAFKLPVVHVD